MKADNSKPYVFSSVAGVMLLLSAACDALFGMRLGRIINTIEHADIQHFFSSVVALLVILLTGYLSHAIGNICAYRESGIFINRIKSALFHTYLSEKKPGNNDLSAFSTKADLVYADWYMARWSLWRNICVFLFAAAAIVSVHPVMFLICLSISLIPLAVPHIMKPFLKKTTIAYTDESKSYINHVQDILLGRSVIIRYGVRNDFSQKHDVHSALLEKKRSVKNCTSSVAQILGEASGFISFIIVILSSGYLVLHNKMSIGGIVSIMQLMNYLVNPVSRIAATRNNMIAAHVVLKELKESILAQSSPLDTIYLSPKHENDLRADHIYWKYPDQENYLYRDSSFCFREKGKYLIRGKSGVGKTTLANILTGDIIPESGMVTIGGTDIKSIDPKTRYRLINYVDQKPYIFHDSLKNNIDLYRGFDESAIRQYLSLFQVDVHPEETISDHYGLSGGERVRICLIRALLDCPQILIVDEPTAGLDHETSKVIMNHLCGLPATVIVISHTEDPEIHMLFDKVITIG